MLHTFTNLYMSPFALVTVFEAMSVYDMSHKLSHASFKLQNKNEEKLNENKQACMALKKAFRASNDSIISALNSKHLFFLKNSRERK